MCQLYYIFVDMAYNIKMNPKISVVMSVYNGARYLKEAIDSILNQTFTDFEFLIVDDCSNDNSPQILKEYSEKDNRIKIITNEFNLGLTKNLNKMIKDSKGEYLARFDCDDVSLPNRFEEQVKFLDPHTNVAMISSWANIMNEQGKIFKTIKYPIENIELKKALIKYNPFFHPSVMMRKSAVENVGPYDESWRFAQDYELWLRISEKYEIANVPKVLLNYRETSGSITGSKNKLQTGFVMKAKRMAIKRGQYPKWNYIFLFRQYINLFVPVKVRKFIKKFF